MYGTLQPYSTPYRYYQNGFDVTWYIMNEKPLPLSTRFFEIEVY